MEDLFENVRDSATPKKRVCVVCGEPAKRPFIMCTACRSAGTAALKRIEADVHAMEASWRDQLKTASEDTQARMVSVIAAQSEAYGPGPNRERGKRITAYKARLAATIRKGGELASIAGMYRAWVDRYADYQLVFVVVMMSGGTVEGVES